ncbi:hypothetical protein NDU88_004278 [Pleurodeles waltl]|uniref:Uncharacterized protein n=1 Tax=Pleurodeles waltl TaxID=8319 RepID=A0AAV7NMZ5_PLEWA|nr:hypothetical protein NDU88_004278 [Pleurodeles waltl]
MHRRETTHPWRLKEEPCRHGARVEGVPHARLSPSSPWIPTPVKTTTVPFLQENEAPDGRVAAVDPVDSDEEEDEDEDEDEDNRTAII